MKHTMSKIWLLMFLFTSMQVAGAGPITTLFLQLAQLTEQEFCEVVHLLPAQLVQAGIVCDDFAARVVAPPETIQQRLVANPMLDQAVRTIVCWLQKGAISLNSQRLFYALLSGLAEEVDPFKGLDSFICPINSCTIERSLNGVLTHPIN